MVAATVAPSSLPRRSRLLVPAGIAVVLVAVLVVVFVLRRESGLPAAESEAYARTTSLFSRGLAALEVGLIDDSKRYLTEAAALAPGEPAIWADLGLGHLRLGEFDAAAAAIERAASLAPDRGDIAYLQGRLETARGRRDDAVRHLRRAIDLDSSNLRARTALVEEIENSGGANADAEAQQLQESLMTAAPGNIAVLLERARLSAKRGDTARLAETVAQLEGLAGAWPPEVVEQYRAVQQAVTAANTAEATRALAFLRNALTRVPAFLDARRRVTPSVELIADPLMTFVKLPVPVATPDAADAALAFRSEPIGSAQPEPWRYVTVFSPDGDASPLVYAADARGVRRVDASGPAVRGVAPAALLALDWNQDFRLDLVAAGASGLQLLVQAVDGTFIDATAQAFRLGDSPRMDATGVWAADVEMDGDLDLVAGVRGAAPRVLRNNGDGTWRSAQPFEAIAGLRAFAWADLDRDGDPDAALVDGEGTLHVLSNLQAGQFEPLPTVPNATSVHAIAAGDINGDGQLDLVTLNSAGVVTRATYTTSGWTTSTLSTWQESAGGVSGPARLRLADLDNNGALDLVAVRGGVSAVWLAYPDRALRRQEVAGLGDIYEVVDLDGDGQLDLVGLVSGQATKWMGHGSLGYRHHVVRPRAQTAAGDQRINSFGIGGEIEVRSGRLLQKQVITGTTVHVGLGTRTAVDVARIVWPNGVAQAEFDPPVDRPLVATQRLKGSCPWVFADDGSGMKFVTDFLWRSPLGLRINAQDTAGITQTEDWVRIGANQLRARDGAYDVRISAELWETHFVDHVSLLAVDHPSEVAVFVDERFAREAPSLAVHSLRNLRSLPQAWDQAGRDVTPVVARQDGRALDSFAKGQYQGIAEDHFVEMDLGAPIVNNSKDWLAAHGWIYPTDSSINVAIGQGRAVVPRGLSLEALDASGRWIVVAPDLGFPAGKNKTILVDLGRVARAGVVGARRLRLRTNLEIYWDSLAVGTASPEPAFDTVRIAPSGADLRYRGYSVTVRERRDMPETPLYERIASVSPRWRDLTGHYTRFGDVQPLLADIDDRYVIMNAGDELRLTFEAPPPPRAGWTRDFVLVGDGWVKDGDFNTGFAKTVLPLPRHGHPDYVATEAEPALERDPVFLQHPSDWQTFHTRFIDPATYLRGLGFDRADP